jgi:hypothetical protein
VGLPLVAEEAGVGVDVGELGWVGWAGVGGAVLRPGSGEVLGPEPVEDEGVALGALGSVAVGVAELRGPGEVEKVVVEVLFAGGVGDCGVGFRGGSGRFGLRCRGIGCGGVAGGEWEKNEERGEGSLLHGGSISGAWWMCVRCLEEPVYYCARLLRSLPVFDVTNEGSRVENFLHDCCVIAPTAGV